ncbi:DUF885 domain-containing protein [Sphingobium aquiterrae]|uniref:DUF885 domain-containing protein n=1 Tax=Sphingobium aquiterrae TaxID=2038656 RepID=UPI0030160FBE
MRAKTAKTGFLMATVALGLAFATPARADDLSSVLHDFETGPAAQTASRPGMPAWPDASPAGVARRKAALLSLKERLRTLPVAGLSDQEDLTRTLLTRNIDVALEGIGFDDERIPFTGGEGFYTRPNGAARNVIIHDKAEAERWIARLEALPAYYAQAIANMRRGIATDFMQPKLVTRIAISTARIIADTPAETDPLMIPLQKLPPAIDAGEAQALRGRALDVLRTKVKPAQRELVAFFEKDYLPRARDSIGASGMKGGDAYYAFLVRKFTTTDLTPEQVHQIGLAEVKRIRGEMNAAMAEMGFKGNLQQFLAFLPTQQQYLAKSNEDYMEKAGEILKRIDHELPRWFGKLPRLTYGIQIKAPDQANSSGAYYRGDPQLGIAGTVMTGRNLTGYPLYNLPAWLLHEGVPGHHLQIALGQERTDLPAFRRADSITPFVEGWALYSERLGGEMGIYRNPYERFGRLAFEIWRACRLVIDTGMHAKGWTRDQGVACLKDNTSLSQRSIDNEVDRYIGWPGQALAYKMGELKISEIRRRAEQALGPRFDIRAFHDALIGDGPLPLAVLDERMDKWIAAQKLKPAAAPVTESEGEAQP